MPIWTVLVLAGILASALGLAGVATILWWVGLGLLAGGLVLSIVGWRSRNSDLRKTLTTRTSPAPVTWERRAARLGWLVAGLAALSLALLAFAVYALVTEQPHLGEAVSQEAGTWASRIAFPIEVQINAPRVSTIIGIGLAVAAIIVGMAAVQTSAALRVLARSHRTSEPLPGSAARAARRVLGSVASRALVERAPDWPASALPDGAADYAGPLRCTVLIPAHDEEAVLGRTLTSLAEQTRPPDRVIVIADNCTDGTVRVAREGGVEVVETVGNTRHKAGALNQVLSRLVRDVDIADVILVMDADSTLAPVFLEEAIRVLRENPRVMAVGGLFSGEDGEGLLGQLQRNEFTRYQRTIDRREGRVFVLTGTASMFRGYALRAVADARGMLIPGVAGEVYDTHARTEDNELTVALKSLGGRMNSPSACRVTTEVMPTPRDLWRQRSRWQRGAVENVADYGFTRTTLQYWSQQLGLVYGVIALNAYLVCLAIALLATDDFDWSGAWFGILAIFIVERTVTAWAAGPVGRVIAVPLVIELAYAWYLQVCFVTSLVGFALRKEAGWNYVPRPQLNALVVPVAVAAAVTGWNPLPASVLETAWFGALATFVAINTVIFATLSLLQLLPPVRKTIHRVQRGRARRRARVA